MIDYEKVLSKTVKDIKYSGIRKYFDIAATMKEVISLSVGEPDFVTPELIRKAGIDSLKSGNTKYTSNRGLFEMRAELSKYVERNYGVSYDAEDEILVTVGGSEAIDVAVRALTNPGDEIIIPQPSYVCYEPIAALAGGVPVIIETKAEDAFKLTAKDLKNAITEKTKLLILPYPCNPTGGIMEKQDLEEIAAVLRGTDIMVISDEVYAELTYGKKHVSIATIDGMRERTVLVNGFSKTFAMTGWRMGYACGPEPIMSQIVKIHQYAIMSAPTTSQYAAVVALSQCENETEKMRDEYNRRRRIMVDGLNEIGLTCREPQGTFYCFPSIKSTGLTSDEFCEQLLYKKHVAVVPGTAFGDSGEGFIRISYCYSTEHIKEGIKRMGEFVNELKKG